MKCVFYAADKPREIMLARAFQNGVKEHGDVMEIRRKAEYGENEDGSDRKWAGPSGDTDVCFVFGVKGNQIFWDHKTLNIPVVYVDKGYTRETKGGDGHTLYSRCSINASSPINYMMQMRAKSDRFERLSLDIKKQRAAGAGHIIYAGSSQKYYDFHKLGDGTILAQKVFRRLKGLTNRQLVYRPKPGDKNAHPIMGAMLSTKAQSMADALRGCHAVVTYGASAVLDAVVAGVPAIVLGEAIAHPVAQLSMERSNDIENPNFPNEVERTKWLTNLAYCQWTAKEMSNGEAWQYLRAEIERQHHGISKRSTVSSDAVTGDSIG